MTTIQFPFQETKEYWINIEDLHLNKTHNFDKDTLDTYTFNKLINEKKMFYEKDCTVMETPNEITIKIVTKKEIDLLYQQYLNYLNVQEEPKYFSKVEKVYTSLDIKDYNNTIDKYRHYKGITFVPIVYLPITDILDIKEREPNSKECLDQLFSELKSLKEFVTIHYIQIPEQIKETVLLENEIQKNIEEFSNTPKITSTKTKKWGTLLFTDTTYTTETTTETTTENTIDTTGNPFETTTEIPIDTITIEERIENYFTSLDVKIPEPEPGCYFDGEKLIYENHTIINGTVTIVGDSFEYSVGEYKMHLPMCIDSLVKKQLPNDVVIVVHDKYKFILQVIRV